MLTKKIKRSEGTFTIFREKEENFRFFKKGRFVGFKSQDDIIWPDLTVNEHLDLVRSLKCLNNKAFENHKDELYELLQLK